MGLDMFLYRVPKVSSIAELNDLESTVQSSTNVGQAAMEFVKSRDYIYDIPIWYNRWEKKWTVYPSYHNAACWRKFNSLHYWFVKNVQDGDDNCEPHLVTMKNIESLLEILLSLTPENCSELFPTKSGFFFGSVEYDENYWHDVQSTIHICHYLLSQVNWHEEILMYCSSW